MAWLTYLFGSGLAFFVGIACVQIGLAMALSNRRGWRAVLRVAAGVGLVVIALSAVPLLNWFYGIAFASTIAGVILLQSSKLKDRRNRLATASMLIILWFAAAAVELRHQFAPRLHASPVRRLYVIGDSISAGLKNDDPSVWPRLFAAQQSVEVVDLSRAGATTAVALNRTKDTALDDGVVLLEIGGNDLLGSTPSDEFARNLDAILDHVCDSGRQVVMFELPLPPLGNEYGRVQRRLAAKHGAQLIPRRILMSILTVNGATLDSLHLTPTGHERMADAVWQILQSAYPSD